LAIGIGILCGFFFIVSFVLLGYAHSEDPLIGAVVGYVSAKAEQVVSYYFGSSSGSMRKTELLAVKNIEMNENG
jgi:hypothetical protein